MIMMVLIHDIFMSLFPYLHSLFLISTTITAVAIQNENGTNIYKIYHYRINII